MRARVLVAALALCAGCESFASPSVVVDLRVLSMVAEPPEILVPADPDEVDVAELGEVEICALVADPADSRRLGYRFTACPRTRDGRCDPADPSLPLGSGAVDDPEEAGGPVSLCATLSPHPTLLEILEASISADALQGFGAIDIQVVLAVWPEEAGPEAAEYARKAVRFGAQLPAERTPNRNPSMLEVVAARAPTGERGLDFALPRGRCADVEPALVSPDEQLQLLPVAADDAREDYLVPTFEGGSRAFTENLSYQFYATAGDWNRFATGGPRDFAGNEPPVDARWTAPDRDDLAALASREIALWIVQRDERGGQSWLESCVRVVP